MDHGFHGRTLATMSASGKPAWEALFEPKVPGFTKVSLGDIEAVKQAVTPRTVAVMLEPIQGEAGVFMAGDEFLRELRRITRELGILLIADEIQTGVGELTLPRPRARRVEPDIVTLIRPRRRRPDRGARRSRARAVRLRRPGRHVRERAHGRRRMRGRRDGAGARVPATVAERAVTSRMALEATTDLITRRGARPRPPSRRAQEP
jgi:hypothetical protein